MFETEINLFLQLHSGPLWRQLMWGLSQLGTGPTYAAVLIVVTFGLDLRRGWLLGQALWWTAGLAQLAKNLCALPRPVHVDSRVVDLPSGEAAQETFTGRGASGFFAGLPSDVVDYYRARVGVDWGLPSGHTSLFSAYCGTLALVVWRRRWWSVTLAAAVAMGWSRMVLGRHFLADVLAGSILGAAVVLAIRALAVAGGAASPLSDPGPGALAEMVRRAGFLTAAFAAPALLLPLAVSDGQTYAAELWGWNLAFSILSRRRTYAGGSGRQRALRVLLAASLAPLCLVVPDMVVGSLGWSGLLGIDLAVAFGGVAVLVVGTVRLAERLGLYD